MVGTDIGKIHKLRQGEGLATVIDGRETANVLLKNKQYEDAMGLKAAKEKAERRQKAAEAFNSYDPLYFYAHHNEMSKMKDEVVSQGQNLIAEGIDDPWKSTDPKSMEFQKNAKYVSKIAETSKLMETKFLEYRKVFDDPTKSKQIANKAEIEDWYYNSSPQKVLDSGEPMPELKFKTPALDTVGEMNKTVDALQKQNPGQVISSDQAMFATKERFANPVDNEEGGFVPAMKQTFASLMPEEKKIYENKAQRSGNTPLEEFTADRILGYSGKRIDLGESIVKDANMREANAFVQEKDGYKVSGTSYKNKDAFAEKRVESILKANDGQIERDVQEGLYGDPDASVKENFDAAKAHYKKIYLDSLATRFEKTKIKGGEAFSKEQIDLSDDLWYRDITSKDPKVSTEAAMFLHGSEDITSGGTIKSAKVVWELESTDYLKEVSDNPILFLEVTAGYKPPSGTKLIEFDEAQMKEVEALTGKTNMKGIELGPEFRQAIKLIYKKAVDKHKELYLPSTGTDTEPRSENTIKTREEVRKGKFD